MSHTLQQLLGITVVSQVLVAMGMNFGLNSVTLIQVPTQPDSFLTTDQLIWTITVTNIGALFGNLLAALVAPSLGVRRLLMICCPLNAISALATGLGHHFAWTLLGRTMTFVALGMAEGTVRGFVAEISPPARRAMFSALISASLYLGQLISILLGSVLNWQTVFLIAGIGPSAFCVFGVIFLPESPKWVLTHQQSEVKARKALQFYHGSATDIDSEIESIRESLEHASRTDDKIPAWKHLGHWETLHPLLLACTQILLFVWCGGATLVLLTALVFEQLQLPLSAYIASSSPVVVAMVCSVLGAPLLERFGRLPLLKLAGTINTIACLVIAVFFFLPSDQQEGRSWMVLAGAALCQMSFSGIIASLTFTFANELLPNRTRTLGANIVIATLSVNGTILVKVYPMLRASIGHGGAFVLHALVSMMQVLFATCCLRETKGLSLEEIQDLFQTQRQRKPISEHKTNDVEMITQSSTQNLSSDTS